MLYQNYYGIVYQIYVLYSLFNTLFYNIWRGLELLWCTILARLFLKIVLLRTHLHVKEKYISISMESYWIRI